jgi:transglutaminase superfamily protein
MIAEIIPDAYDAEGVQVSQPFLKLRAPHPTFPMGRYISQPLTIECGTIAEVRSFLANCEYVSDKELFDKNDYWQPPDEFERRKKGDCEDFALWTWRQLLEMGYDARFIGGSCGRYGAGHAWVEYFENDTCFLVEPLFSKISDKMPRLTTLKYKPKLSVSWEGKTVRYFAHKDRYPNLSWLQLTPLVREYLFFWSKFWLRNFYRIPSMLWRTLRNGLFKRDTPVPADASGVSRTVRRL